jgi:hypothetical protein
LINGFFHERLLLMEQDPNAAPVNTKMLKDYNLHRSPLA